VPLGFTTGLVGNGDALPRREPPVRAAVPGGRNGDDGRLMGDGTRMLGLDGRRLGLVARELNNTPARSYGEFARLGDGTRKGWVGDNSLASASGGVGGKPVVGGGVGGGLLGSFALLGNGSPTLTGGGATKWIPPRLATDAIGCLEEAGMSKACWVESGEGMIYGENSELVALVGDDRGEDAFGGKFVVESVNACCNDFCAAGARFAKVGEGFLSGTPVSTGAGVRRGRP